MNQIEIYEERGKDETEKIPRLEVNGEPVLTSSQLANFFGCSTANLRNTFKRNKADFVEGKHYFKLEGDALKELKRSVTDCYDVTNGYAVYLNVNSITMWTTLGAARFAKSLRTRKAWEVYEKLAMNYFSGKKIIEEKSAVNKTSEEKISEKISKNKLTDEKKIKFLLQAAKITKDAATREKRVSAILCKLTITWLAGASGHRTYTKLFTLSVKI